MKTKAGIAIERWVKENGFTIKKSAPHYGHYSRTEADGFKVMIIWHYNDDEDKYYVKWQLWIDGLEAETDKYMFTEGYVLFDVVEYIKENNDRMIGLCKDNINKRLKNLIN